MRILLALLLLPLFTFAQKKELHQIFPVKDGKVYYERVFDVESASKDQLYNRAKTWAVSNQSAKDGTIAEDKEAGAITTNGMFTTLMAIDIPMQKDSLKTEWQYWYNVRVFVKDNRAKVVVENLKFTGLGPSNLFAVEEYRTIVESMYAGFNKKILNKYLASTEQNFEKANLKIEALLNNLIVALKSNNKSDFDF